MSETATVDGRIHDPASGLYSEAFFRVTVHRRVAVARRGLRPFGLILLRLVEADGAAPEPHEVAVELTRTLRDSDTPCRLEDGRFALILEDTPLGGAVTTIERVDRILREKHQGASLWAGVASYPAHAFDPDEMIAQAESALAAAAETAGGAIVVATPPDD